MNGNNKNSANQNMTPIYDKWVILRFILAIIFTPLFPFITQLLVTHFQGINDPGSWIAIKFWGEVYAVVAYSVEILFALPIVYAMVVTRHVSLVNFLILGAAAGVSVLTFIALIAGRIEKLFEVAPVHDLVLGAFLGATHATIFWILARPDKIAFRSA